MRRTYKFRLYPTKKQEKILIFTLETCREIYNSILGLKEYTWETQKLYISRYSCNNLFVEWKKSHDYLNNIHSQIFLDISERVDLAFRSFFRRIKQRNNNERVGYPRFKGIDRYDSFCFPGSNSGYKIDESKKLKLSKIGCIKIDLHRELKGKTKRLIIKREGQKWFACFIVELPDPKIKKRKPKNVGLDLGISSFATLDDGTKIDNPKFYNKKLKTLRKYQSRYSNMKELKHEDPKKKKAKKILVRLHTKVRNQRKDFLHKESRKLVNQYSHIFVEDLNIKKMLRDSYPILARHISDAGWFEFLKMLDYKAEEAGSLVVKVNPAYTTQICSNCQKEVIKDLSERVHKCGSCGLEMDRDLNAAKNILRIGIDSLTQV